MTTVILRHITGKRKNMIPDPDSRSSCPPSLWKILILLARRRRFHRVFILTTWFSGFIGGKSPQPSPRDRSLSTQLSRVLSNFPPSHLLTNKIWWFELKNNNNNALILLKSADHDYVLNWTWKKTFMGFSPNCLL